MNPKITLSMAINAIEQISTAVFALEHINIGTDSPQYINQIKEYIERIKNAEPIIRAYCLDTDSPNLQVLEQVEPLRNKLNNLSNKLDYLYSTASEIDLDYFERFGVDLFGVSLVIAGCAERLKKITKYRPELTTPDKQPTQGKQPGVNLPKELDTPEAHKYFARAIAAGYMELTATGYKWLFGGNRGKARLGYFLGRVYRPILYTDIITSAQYRILEGIFNVVRLDRAVCQADVALEKTQAIRKWRREIDEKIFFD